MMYPSLQTLKKLATGLLVSVPSKRCHAVLCTWSCCL